MRQRLGLAMVLFVTAIGAGVLYHSLWSGSHATAARGETLASNAPQPGLVKLTDAQLKNIEVRTVTENALPVHLNVNGRIGFNEDQTVPILAPIGGHVINVRARIGDRVKKGDALFDLKSREVAAMESEYQESRKDRDLAEKTYAMTQELFKHNAASNIALQQAENDLAKARTRAIRTDEQLRVLGLDPKLIEQSVPLEPLVSIRAPRDGTVVERRVTEGQFVQGDGTALLVIADLTSVWVTADVFERDLHAIRLNQPAVVTTLAYPNEEFKANVSFISSVVDPQTRTLKVRLSVANPDGRLKPEMFASVNLTLAEDRHALMVPNRAVITDNGTSHVFVRAGPDAFAERVVEAESAGAGQVKVVRGLAAGEQIVSHGSLLLRQLQQAPPPVDD